MKFVCINISDKLAVCIDSIDISRSAILSFDNFKFAVSYRTGCKEQLSCSVFSRSLSPKDGFRERRIVLEVSQSVHCKCFGDYSIFLPRKLMKDSSSNVSRRQSPAKVQRKPVASLGKCVLWFYK
ncbi:uncharacterized protein LOC105287998 [Ooceraea biroi]|uniref:uncharacterized protein LOC105287998 n=1 Tax=Ooceraea biroi TaxID=2015173 RepID=UPI0005B81398|nr:uncharacterized protein LOC105287998 [Ooceraea biroi]